MLRHKAIILLLFDHRKKLSLTSPEAKLWGIGAIFIRLIALITEIVGLMKDFITL